MPPLIVTEAGLINNAKIVVVMPAYNAEKTLEHTVSEVPRSVVDDIMLVDDRSRDDTVDVAQKLGLHVIVHEKNKGYGGNQKTCYTAALRRGADIVVMVHPDYQYTPKLIPAIASCIASGLYDVVLGSPHPRRAAPCAAACRSTSTSPTASSPRPRTC